MQYRITIEAPSGAVMEERVLAQGALKIGRLDSNDIALASNSVSREHARIFIQEGRCFIEDLNSSNGVLLDGQRIQGSRELYEGAQVQIGDFLLLLDSSDPGLAAPAADPLADPLRYPRLVRVGDVLEGETFILTESENSIGRGDDQFVLLADASISRHHAVLINEMNRYIVMDQGSSNGTRINEQPIDEPTLISGGDILRLGSLQFVFAEPGQNLNPRDYRRFAQSSQRGAVIAITVLALMLVLIACAIVIFLVLDRRSQDPSQGDPATMTDTASSQETARNLLAEGHTLMASTDGTTEPDWDRAMVKFQLALQYDSSLTDASHAYSRANQENDISLVLREAQSNLTSAERILSAGNQPEAAELFLQVRGTLLTIPPTSYYAASATNLIALRIDPALITIRRQLGHNAVVAQNPSLAVLNFQQVLEIWQELPEDGRPDIGRDIGAELWQALVAAGDESAMAGQHPLAVEYYTRAAALGELPEDVASRLEEARRHLQ